MCIECGRIFCANMCPNYGGHSAERGRPRGACDLCGQQFYPYDPIYRVGKKVFCEDCHERRQASRSSPKTR